MATLIRIVLRVCVPSCECAHPHEGTKSGFITSRAVAGEEWWKLPYSCNPPRDITQVRMTYAKFRMFSRTPVLIVQAR